MAAVVANMSMSLDGFIEGPGGGVDEVFQWVSRPSGAAYLHEAVRGTGAIVTGRRLFDLAQGWGGRHPADAPVFVVTHRPVADWPHPEADFTFVTDGVAAAVAQAKAAAGDLTVGVASADLTRQCLDLDLLDGIAVDLVPVLLGSGTPFFGGLVRAPIRLDMPTVVEGDGVTHLYYGVRHG